MKKRLSLFLILAALTVKDTSHAQTNAQQARRWQQLNRELDSLYQQGKYAEAIPVAVKLVEVTGSIYGPDHPHAG